MIWFYNTTIRFFIKCAHSFVSGYSNHIIGMFLSAGFAYKLFLYVFVCFIINYICTLNITFVRETIIQTTSYCFKTTKHLSHIPLLLLTHTYSHTGFVAIRVLACGTYSFGVSVCACCNCVLHTRFFFGMIGGVASSDSSCVHGFFVHRCLGRVGCRGKRSHFVVRRHAYRGTSAPGL